MKAKFVTLFEATTYEIWLKNFIFGLRTMDSISKPLRIYYDNSTSVFITKNNKSGSQSKHINIKYLGIKKYVKENKVIIEHISTKLIITNLLTKGMPLFKFKYHIVKIGLGSIM